MVDAHEMKSDGYQTFNYQKRDAFSAKYQYSVSDNTVFTAFSSVMHLNSNTPNQKGSTRAQIAQFGDNFLMSDDPTSPLYYKFNFYQSRRTSSTSASGRTSAMAGRSTTRSTRCGTTTSRTSTA